MWMYFGHGIWANEWTRSRILNISSKRSSTALFEHVKIVRKVSFLSYVKFKYIFTNSDELSVLAKSNFLSSAIPSWPPDSDSSTLGEERAIRLAPTEPFLLFEAWFGEDGAVKVLSKQIKIRMKNWECTMSREPENLWGFQHWMKPLSFSWERTRTRRLCQCRERKPCLLLRA